MINFRILELRWNSIILGSIHKQRWQAMVSWVSQMSKLMHKHLSTSNNGGGEVKDPKNLVNVVYECALTWTTLNSAKFISFLMLPSFFIKQTSSLTNSINFHFQIVVDSNIIDCINRRRFCCILEGLLKTPAFKSFEKA